MKQKKANRIITELIIGEITAIWLPKDMPFLKLHLKPISIFRPQVFNFSINN